MSHPLPCPLWLIFALQYCIFSLLLSFFSAIFHFVFSPFHLRHTSLVSWYWYTFPLIVFNPPPMSLLWYITLCFPFISSTVCGYFHVLFCLITHLWLCRKQKFILRLLFMCSVYALQLFRTYTQQQTKMHTKYIECKDKHNAIHKHRPQTDMQQNPFDIYNW